MKIKNKKNKNYYYNFIHKISTKTIIIFHRSDMLKVNPKCGFAQYNGSKTYKYNYYVSLK